jgi:hypothetical protein
MLHGPPAWAAAQKKIAAHNSSAVTPCNIKIATLQRVPLQPRAARIPGSFGFICWPNVQLIRNPPQKAQPAAYCCLMVLRLSSLHNWEDSHGWPITEE